MKMKAQAEGGWDPSVDVNPQQQHGGHSSVPHRPASASLFESPSVDSIPRASSGPSGAAPVYRPPTGTRGAPSGGQGYPSSSSSSSSHQPYLAQPHPHGGASSHAYRPASADPVLSSSGTLQSGAAPLPAITPTGSIARLLAVAREGGDADPRMDGAGGLPPYVAVGSSGGAGALPHRPSASSSGGRPGHTSHSASPLHRDHRDARVDDSYGQDPSLMGRAVSSGSGHNVATGDSGRVGSAGSTGSAAPHHRHSVSELRGRSGSASLVEGGAGGRGAGSRPRSSSRTGSGSDDEYSGIVGGASAASSEDYVDPDEREIVEYEVDVAELQQNMIAVRVACCACFRR